MKHPLNAHDRRLLQSALTDIQSVLNPEPLQEWQLDRYDYVVNAYEKLQKIVEFGEDRIGDAVKKAVFYRTGIWR